MPKNPAKVTILLPARNESATIKRAVNSLQKQTESDFRLNIINDGSTDDTAEVVSSIDDTRICLYNIPPSGIAKALNFGISHVQSPFLARMDADDIAHPNRLKMQLDLLTSDSSCDVAATTVEVEENDNTKGMGAFVKRNNLLLSHQEMLGHRFVDTPLIHPTAMMRTDAIRKIGGYCEEEVPEDYELWLRMFQAGMRFKKLDSKLLKWTDRPQRLTRIHQNYSKDSFDKVRIKYLCEFIRTLPTHKNCLSIWGAGKHGKMLKKSLGENEIFCKNFIDVDTKKTNRHIAGIPCISHLQIDSIEKNFVLVAVRARGAAQEIKNFLEAQGALLNQDFLPIY